MVSKEEQEYRLALGEALKRFRERMGLTLGNVEEVTGIKKFQISRWESGKRPISERDLNILAEVYRAKPSLIEQSAYDHMNLGEYLNLNKLLKCKFDLDGAHFVIKSTVTGSEELYRIPEYLLVQIKEDFKI